MSYLLVFSVFAEAYPSYCTDPESGRDCTENVRETWENQGVPHLLPVFAVWQYCKEPNGRKIGTNKIAE